MANYLKQLPGTEELLKKHKPGKEVPEVNGHLHSPWSFCAFESISQMFDMAVEEDVKVLGINDFFTVDGYGEFEDNAMRSRVFPLFNIEFMGLMKDLQGKDIRVNDPNNPGRVYFSGKALRQPLSVSPENLEFLKKLQENSQVQVREMCKKTDALLQEIRAPFGIRYEKVREGFARNLVRERHIARAVREAAYAHFPGEEERRNFFEMLFGGKPSPVSFRDVSGVENGIRSALLKKGGRAFVPEDSQAFPDLGRILDFILDAGGIPCYPVLLDDEKGNMTGFEGDWDRMDGVLQSLGVSCLELIPARNSLEKLEAFVRFFRKKNYVISFGSEHNSPGLFPIALKVQKDRELTPELKETSYRGVCVLAAHQYLVDRGGEGFIKSGGKADLEHMDFYEDLGHAVIREFTSVKP